MCVCARPLVVIRVLWYAIPECPGTTGNEGDVNGFINDKNIANFTGCTIIEGGLDIMEMTFDGFDGIST